MGKKGSSANKKGPMGAASSHPRLQQAASTTLREKSSGKHQKALSAKSMLKLDHIKNLAIWAGVEVSIPSLSAFFGHRLATTAEALDVPLDPSLFFCQRCESIIQPGCNCTVRIKKNKAKVRHQHKKTNIDTKNSVVYKCHVCSHQNLKRGTPQQYMKELCPPKMEQIARLDPIKLTIQMASKHTIVTESIDDIVKKDLITLAETPEDDPTIHAPPTPITTVGTTLLDSKRRKRTRAGAKKSAESGSCSAVAHAENSIGSSNKQKRKSWTTLKEIAERDEQEDRRSLSNSEAFLDYETGIGYYWGPKDHEKLLISNYIYSPSLALYLHDTDTRRLTFLSLGERLKISLDVARCLNYLHNESSIPHGNLKSTNIMIETSNLNAHVTDYRLHRIMTSAGTDEQCR